MKDLLQVSLFGRFSAFYQGKPLIEWETSKVQELLCYLLLHRDRPHPREHVASMIWGDYYSTSQSKSYLRKALWKLQKGGNKHVEFDLDNLLHVENAWIELRTEPHLALDVVAFEQAYVHTKDTSGQTLTSTLSQQLKDAVALYTADLLDGWYQDWCLLERERLRHLYLIMLDKLMAYCEAHGEYEAGIVYGDRILGHDRARECTHRQVMRLYALKGDRTEALRQYQRCSEALHEELDIAPARSTTALYEQIRNDFTLPPEQPFGEAEPRSPTAEMRAYLLHLQAHLSETQHHIEKMLRAASEE